MYLLSYEFQFWQTAIWPKSNINNTQLIIFYSHIKSEIKLQEIRLIKIKTMELDLFKFLPTQLLTIAYLDDIAHDMFLINSLFNLSTVLTKILIFNS